jgi:hypothetical protein
MSAMDGMFGWFLQAHDQGGQDGDGCASSEDEPEMSTPIEVSRGSVEDIEDLEIDDGECVRLVSFFGFVFRLQYPFIN